jgi:hypothetical protein
LIAHFPARDIGADFFDFAGYFQTEDGGGSGRWRVLAFALLNVRAVYARGRDADTDFT